MSVSRARRHALTAAKEAAEHAGTPKGHDAALLALAMSVLELAHQVKRFVDTTPIYGPPDDQR